MYGVRVMPRRKYRTGQGGFVVPPQGRQPVGARPGESTEDRDKRVLAVAMANPNLRAEDVAKQMGVPKGVASRYVHRAKELRKEAATKSSAPAKFLPVQLFTPGPPVPPTAAERLAAVPDDVKAEIAARYGATFKA